MRPIGKIDDQLCRFFVDLAEGSNEREESIQQKGEKSKFWLPDQALNKYRHNVKISIVSHTG